MTTDFEKEKNFEEKFPELYALFSEIGIGVEEDRTEWEIVQTFIASKEQAEKILTEIDEFLSPNPAEYEHTVEEIANNYFDDTNEFIRWVEQIKRFVASARRKFEK